MWLFMPLICGGGATAAPSSRTRTILFLDTKYIASAEGLVRATGSPKLVSAFSDLNGWVGWGYPSAWRDSNGTVKLVYNTNYNFSHYPRVVNVAASNKDGVHFSPVDTRSVAIANRLTTNQVFVSDNKGNPERGALFQDTTVDAADSHHLKMLFANASTFTSDEHGLRWKPSGVWTSKSTDPMIDAFELLSPSRQVRGYVATSRPPALRKSGRHTGIHTGATWGALAQKEAKQCLPIDKLYRDDAQFYGLPAFPYAGLYVGFPTRMRCQPKCTWLGGKLSGELAVSHNGINFTHVTQTDDSILPLHPLNKDGVLFKNEPGTVSEGQIYPTSMLRANDGSLLVYASVASLDHGHGVSSSHCPGTTCQCQNNASFPCSHIATYTLRQDGFMRITRSTAAPASTLHRLKGSFFRTVKLQWQAGGNLTINAACGEKGIARVQLLQFAAAVPTSATAIPIPGFLLNESETFSGDSTKWQPQWSSGRTVSTLPDAVLAVEVHLEGTASIYSISGNFVFGNA